MRKTSKTIPLLSEEDVVVALEVVSFVVALVVVVVVVVVAVVVVVDWEGRNKFVTKEPMVDDVSGAVDPEDSVGSVEAGAGGLLAC